MEGGANKEDSGAKTLNSKDGNESLHPADDDDGDAGTGQSYDCIFCKRGFSTAQALGGHMNIHRRDRARTRAPVYLVSSRLRKPDEGSENYKHYLSYADSHPSQPSVSDPRKNYAMYFTGSMSTIQAMTSWVPSSEDASYRTPQELRLFHEELYLGLGLHADDRGMDTQDREEKRQDKACELDLELRLGHDS